MNKVDITVGTLMDMVHHKELQLPEMQRGYVRRAPCARDLLDSLYGYPSGASLGWGTEKDISADILAVEKEVEGLLSEILGGSGA